MLAYMKMAKTDCRPWFIPQRFDHQFQNIQNIQNEDDVSKEPLETPDVSLEDSANDSCDPEAPLCLVVQKNYQSNQTNQNKGLLPTPPGSPHNFSSTSDNSMSSPLRVDIHRPSLVLSPVSSALQETQHQRLHSGMPLLSSADFLDNPIFARALASGAPKRTRGEKKPIPEEQKDNKYYERRKRNNLAAKKSRDARKSREDQIAVRATSLEKENAVLRAQVVTLREEADSLRLLLIQKRSR